MREIMILRTVDNETRLKIFQVDNDTLAKLTRIRGNLFKDDFRLKLVKDFPTPEPEIPEHIKRQAEQSWQLHLAGTRQASPVQTVKAEPVLTFEEKVKEDWRTRPNIRAEFVSLASYEAYCRAVRDGRAKVCGRG